MAWMSDVSLNTPQARVHMAMIRCLEELGYGA